MLKNGNLVRNSLHDKHINIWNFKNETLKKYIISDYPISSYLKVWDTETRDYKGSFKSSASSLAVPKNGYLAVGRDDSIIEIWNVDTKSMIRSLYETLGIGETIIS